MNTLSAGMTVYVDFTSDSSTEFSGNQIKGKAVLDRVEDGYIYGRMVENQQTFMCNESDAAPCPELALIDRVGGIERAKAIVNGAGYRHYYYNLTLGSWQQFAKPMGELISLKELCIAVAYVQHYQEFEKFLTDNDMPIQKNGYRYLFSNRLVYDAWVKSPEHGLNKIHEMKNTEIVEPHGQEITFDEYCKKNQHSTNCTRLEAFSMGQKSRQAEIDIAHDDIDVFATAYEREKELKEQCQEKIEALKIELEREKQRTVDNYQACDDIIKMNDVKIDELTQQNNKLKDALRGDHD
ncbi:hypothetical protein [Acinetobacter sp. CFCC 10889]|uniref:hypothetical protein n=1 Tax=Acinetobacter sp. CFCC 10889 TaxID=1775557 RepID=UPI000DD01D24|nr:hypothetical protein [Acinetobacter sp. CFCC 10889]